MPATVLPIAVDAGRGGRRYVMWAFVALTVGGMVMDVPGAWIHAGRGDVGGQGGDEGAKPLVGLSSATSP